MSSVDVTQVPMVDYLVLGDQPHLEANECVGCGAHFFDRRNACASCGAFEFRRTPVPTQGEVRAFTIVSRSSPNIPVPFVAATIDCGGTAVRANILNVLPDPDHVRVGMPVRLTTTTIGTDGAGAEAIGFGFEPEEADNDQ